MMKKVCLLMSLTSMIVLLHSHVSVSLTLLTKVNVLFFSIECTKTWH